MSASHNYLSLILVRAPLQKEKASGGHQGRYIDSSVRSSLQSNDLPAASY